MSLDQVHVGVTAGLWLAGLVYIALTLPKVSPVRRVTYVVALPLWAGWSVVYGYAFVSWAPSDAPLTVGEVALRVLLFGIALEGFLVPFVDRLEVKHRMQEIRIRQVGS
jgi:hypothetical protein